MLDSIDGAIINELQGGLPIAERPFEAAARQLGLDETQLIGRIERLLAAGYLSRFGPMYNAEQMGGAFCLCALSVPVGEVDAIADLINAHPEVAHNYERDHELNIWFVLATETAARIEAVADQIETETGYQVFRFPKLEEFFVGLKIKVDV